MYAAERGHAHTRIGTKVGNRLVLYLLVGSLACPTCFLAVYAAHCVNGDPYVT
jgi:hypothetical protein